jgi:hypothetical protein
MNGMIGNRNACVSLYITHLHTFPFLEMQVNLSSTDAGILAWRTNSFLEMVSTPLAEKSLFYKGHSRANVMP